uniref:Secreted protein n=1 Tax=Anopheles merus TaxID=30066 RepID=A0A182VCV9_ANOME
MQVALLLALLVTVAASALPIAATSMFAADESRSSRGDAMWAAALDLTGDTMEPIGEAEVADTDEEGGVEAGGADRLAEESGFANRTPSYWTPLNSIVTTSFWSPLLASPAEREKKSFSNSVIQGLNCMPVMPSGELNGSLPAPPPPPLVDR